MNPLERMFYGFQSVDISRAQLSDYSAAKTAGSARVKKITQPGGPDSHFQEVELDFRKDAENDFSQHLMVPAGVFKEGRSVEVMVKVSKGSWYVEPGAKCLVAIRPLREETYGMQINERDPNLRAMFELNGKHYTSCPAFFRRYMS